mgnify:CR=1 FL=1
MKALRILYLAATLAVLSVGDAIIVKVLDIDNQGKISLKKIGEQTEE